MDGFNDGNVADSVLCYLRRNAMTKDKFDETMQLFLDNSCTDDMYNLVYNFLDSNVCIPKGENRHPYADVIHSYTEGLNNIEVLRSGGWVEFKQSGMCLCIGDEYRIKPSEPVYEYKFKIWHANKEFTTDNYYTEEEVNYGDNGKYCIIESTKRWRR